mgnify:CR=1 FL=1
MTSIFSALSCCIGIVSCNFFFQAEDGIRDLVRSRGLGDVYKRQPHNLGFFIANYSPAIAKEFNLPRAQQYHPVVVEAVSYTHLTLPTSDLV